MNAETTPFLELLEQRIALLGLLSNALLAARTDVVSFDLNGLEARIADQDRLCGDIRALDAQIDQVQRQCSTRLRAEPALSTSLTPAHDDRRLREILTRLHKDQVRLKQLNDSHQILLHRSRRTVSALLNSYRSFALTYSDPSSVRASGGERA